MKMETFQNDEKDHLYLFGPVIGLFYVLGFTTWLTSLQWLAELRIPLSNTCR